MSNFIQPAFDPAAGIVRDATWIDDYFGPHQYGVQFDAGGPVYRPDQAEVAAAGECIADLRAKLVAAEAENRELRAELERREAGSVRDAERRRRCWRRWKSRERVRREERERIAKVADECVLIGAETIRALGDTSREICCCKDDGPQIVLSADEARRCMSLATELERKKAGHRGWPSLDEEVNLGWVFQIDRLLTVRALRYYALSPSQLVAEASAETVRVQDDLGRLLHAAEADRDSVNLGSNPSSPAIKTH